MIVYGKGAFKYNAMLFWGERGQQKDHKISQGGDHQKFTDNRVSISQGEGGGMQKNNSLAVKRALAHRLQHRAACRIQNGRQGAAKWPT